MISCFCILKTAQLLVNNRAGQKRAGVGAVAGGLGAKKGGEGCSSFSPGRTSVKVEGIFFFFKAMKWRLEAESRHRSWGFWGGEEERKQV